MKKTIAPLLFVLLMTAAGCQPHAAVEPTPVEGIPLAERTEAATAIPPAPTDAPDSDGTGGGGNTSESDGIARFLLVDNNGVLWAKPVEGGDAVALSGDTFRAVIPYSAAPIGLTGTQAAFLTQPTEQDSWVGLALTTADLATGEIRAHVGLQHPTYDHEAVMLNITMVAGYASLLTNSTFRWSPVDDRLAFAGMVEGLPSDIYVLDGSTQLVERMTATPAYSINPIWSPDGQTIFFFENESFNEEDFTPVNRSLMAINTADRAITRVEILAGEGKDEWLGWLDSSTLLVYEADDCGPKNLRAIDLPSMTVTPVFSGPFTSADFDPVTGAIVVGVGIFSPSCEGVGPEGVYRLSLGSEPESLAEIEVISVAWSVSLNAFIVKSGSVDRIVLLVMPSGSIGELPGDYPAQIDASATGVIAWLMENGQLFIGDKAGPSRLIAEDVGSFMWSPSGHYLAVMQGGNVSLAVDPDYSLTPLFTGDSFSGSYGGTWAE